MATYADFTQGVPTDADFLVGYKPPAVAGANRRYLFSDVKNAIVSSLSLGTAATKNVGSNPNDVPQNSAIGVTIQAQDATLQSIAATGGGGADKMLFTTGVDTWAEATITAFARTLLDDTTAVNARTTLGLVIGTDVEAKDAGLTAIAGLTTAADKMIYTTALDVYATADLTAFARTLLDDASAATARTTLGLGSTDDVTFEDIQTNTRYLGKEGVNIASANNVTAGDGNFFVVTGTTQMNLLDNTGWTSGSEVTLEFAAVLTLKHNQAPSGAFAAFLLESSIDLATSAGDAVTFKYNGTAWREIARALA